MRETLKSIEANIFYDNCTKNLHSFTNKEEKISFTKQSSFLVQMPYKTETRGPTTCRTMNGATMRKAQSKLPTSYAQLLRQFPFAKKLQTQTVSTEKLQKTFSYKKAACKMFMKFDTFMVGFVSGNRPRRCEKKNFVEANIRDRKLASIVNKHSASRVSNWHFAGTGRQYTSQPGCQNVSPLKGILWTKRFLFWQILQFSHSNKNKTCCQT